MKHVALVALFSFALIFELSRTLALDSASLQTCAAAPDQVLIDYETSKSFLFKNRDLFKIDLPVSGALVSLPPEMFPEERQNCFDFTRGGRVKFEELTATEMKKCQDAKHRAHFSQVTKAELAEAAELILGDYFRTTVELGSSIMNKKSTEEGRQQRQWAQEKLDVIRERFAACEELTDLDASARETRADVLERLRAMSSTKTAFDHSTKSAVKTIQ